jgi:hypothetical protein
VISILINPKPSIDSEKCSLSFRDLRWFIQNHPSAVSTNSHVWLEFLPNFLYQSSTLFLFVKFFCFICCLQCSFFFIWILFSIFLISLYLSLVASVYSSSKYPFSYHPFLFTYNFVCCTCFLQFGEVLPNLNYFRLPLEPDILIH